MSDNGNARAYWRSGECGGITLCDSCGLARLPKVRAGKAYHAWLVAPDDPSYGTHGDMCANCGESVGLSADIIASRLDYLRECIRNEYVSYGDLCEMYALEQHIRNEGDVTLMEWAGIPEHG